LGLLEALPYSLLLQNYADLWLFVMTAALALMYLVILLKK